MVEGEDVKGTYNFPVDIGDSVEYPAMGILGIVSGLCVYSDRSMGACFRYTANGEIKDLWIAIDDLKLTDDED